MRQSLRFRLLLHTLLATAIILGLLSAAVYFFVRRSLSAEFNSALMVKARALVTMAEQRDGKVTFEYDAQEMPEFATRAHPDYCEVWDHKQQVLFRSPSLADQDLPATATSTEGLFQDLRLPSGKAGRVLTIAAKPRVENDDGRSEPDLVVHPITLAVATSTTSLDRTITRLQWIVSGLCAAAIAACGAIMLGVVGRAVRPVQQLAADIEALRETDLSRRLQRSDIPEELRPVVERLNGLLGRLDTAFAREKAFTADVAHELRTPLAGLQATLEVCRSRPREALGYESAIDKCRLMTDRMQSMVENLLLLCRAEAGQLAIEREEVDICLLLEECWPLFCDRADSRRLQVAWEMPESCPIQTDREKLRIVAHNLLDNAVSYANEGGQICIRIVPGDVVSIEVSNTGNQIDGSDVPLLFERFWRGDQARSGTGTHCGLGLSLCQRLLKLINAKIEIQTDPNGWFIARVSIPKGT